MDVFPSDTRADAERARDLDQRPSGQGLRLCLDGRELIAGQPWPPVPEEAIGREAKAAAVPVGLIGGPDAGIPDRRPPEAGPIRPTDHAHPLRRAEQPSPSPRMSAACWRGEAPLMPSAGAWHRRRTGGGRHPRSRPAEAGRRSDLPAPGIS